MEGNLCLFLGLLLGLLAWLLCLSFLLLVHNQTCPALILVPLEASEVGLVQFVIRLASLRQPP